MWRDLTVRYKQTVVGVAWAVFQPLLVTAVYTVIFGRYAKFDSGGVSYPLFVFGGLLPWFYFASTLGTGAGVLVANANLVTKVYFPRVLLPLAAALTPVVDLLLGIVVLAVGMIALGEGPGSYTTLLAAPAFLLIAVTTAVGLVLLLSAINVRYRDVPYAIPVFLQVLPLLSGVPFTATSVPEKWQWILALNPLSTAIGGWRWAIFGTPAPEVAHALIGSAVSVGLVVVGFFYFRSAEPRFADQI